MSSYFCLSVLYLENVPVLQATHRKNYRKKKICIEAHYFTARFPDNFYCQKCGNSIIIADTMEKHGIDHMLHN